jgi:hypothetical protein
MDAVETIERDGWTAKLYQNNHGDGPRKDYDNLGTMVCWHRRYDLGDRQPTADEKEALNRGGFKLLERYLRIAHHAVVVIKLGLLDHSGLHMYAGGGSNRCDPGGWDSGTVGFIYATKADLEKFGIEFEQVAKQLVSEIETYDQYLTGDIYGYQIKGPDGQDGDSCWGFYGHEYALEQMTQALEAEIKSEREEAAKIEVMMHV